MIRGLQRSLISISVVRLLKLANLIEPERVKVRLCSLTGFTIAKFIKALSITENALNFLNNVFLFNTIDIFYIPYVFRFLCHNVNNGSLA
jgi:hypothetical protein